MFQAEIDPRKSLMLNYHSLSEAKLHLAKQATHVMCVVGYGLEQHKVIDQSVLWVNMPVLGANSVYEVWTSNQPVRSFGDGAIAGKCNEDIFFGGISIQLDPTLNFSDLVQRAYLDIFNFLQRNAYKNLLRVWNYFPEINTQQEGMERYRSFSSGRHEALIRNHINVEDTPAACALGSHGGSLVIYFLAGRLPGQQIENPRQISAYHYPQQYGPRSPAFSRATLAFKETTPTLFISGTASILGHETVHLGSVRLQTLETLKNIQAVIDQAGSNGFQFVGFQAGAALKVYVRHDKDMQLVRDIICQEWGVVAQLIVLQADICREDLLLEIEAVCWGSHS